MDLLFIKLGLKKKEKSFSFPEQNMKNIENNLNKMPSKQRHKYFNVTEHMLMGLCGNS